MRDTAAAVQPVSATVSWTGTPAVDVAAGVVAQLREGGVTVRWVPGCSRESDQPLLLPSRRADRSLRRRRRQGGVVTERATAAGGPVTRRDELAPLAGQPCGIGSTGR